MPHVLFVPLTGFRIREEKLLALGMSLPGLAPRAKAIGQLLALSVILGLITLWRLSPTFNRFALATNALILLAGVVLTGEQIAGYFFSGGA